MEDRNQVLGVMTGNIEEGMKVFIEKRKPSYPV